MASVLLTISGTVMNVLAFSGTIFFFSKLMDYGEKTQKTCWKRFRGTQANEMKIEKTS